MLPLFILIASAVVHFWSFGFPSSIVFDEVYFGRFVSDYWHGTYFFDVHPPLSRLLISGLGKLMGLDAIPTQWLSVGGELDPAMTALRLLPTLAGALLPLVIYLICRNFKLSKAAASAAALIVTFENSLVAHSRFIMQESMLILFGFLGVLFYQKFKAEQRRRHRSAWLGLSALFVAASISSKWIGLSYLAVIFALEIWDLLAERGWKGQLARIIKRFAATAGIYAAVIAIIYSSAFAIHFAALPRTGSGDAFMTAQFQKTLEGNKNFNDPRLTAPNFFQKLVEIDKRLYTAQKSITATHPSGTKWYTWPLMIRGVYLWHNGGWSGTDKNNELYILGNPLLYWLGTLSVLITIGLAAYCLIRRRGPDADAKRLMLFIIFGYLMNLIPYSFIGRILFLYHYETALVFSLIAIAFLLDRWCPVEKRALTATVLVLSAFLMFLYFSPLTYGTPLTPTELQHRMWLKSWR